jgi:hypothetical protein
MEGVLDLGVDGVCTVDGVDTEDAVDKGSLTAVGYKII